MIKRILPLYFLFCATPLYGGIRSALNSIKLISVHSIKQKIVNKTTVVLEGDAEALFDHKLHLWADRIVVDKAKQTVIAHAEAYGFVRIENPDFVMLADYVELHLDTKTGFAKNIKVHVKEGFLSSSCAKKIDDQTWEMDYLTYTSCDHTTPHWAFTASHAALYKNSVLKASGLLFKINGFPVFAFPALIFPLQNRAGSGFLMPRLSFDAHLGFGFRQEYYWLLSSHCDTTFGFNVVEKKGFILSDEFRWAKSPENYLIIDSHYAEEWNALLEREGRIVRATDKHYWVQGKYFQPFLFGEFTVRNLIRFDFGTDKRIGYHFLNDSERVEDSFYNSIIQRYRDRKQHMQLVVHSERSLRKQFSCEKEKQEDGTCVTKKKEREEKVSIAYLPHYEWNCGRYNLLPGLSYRHDILFDNAFLESRNIEKWYVNQCLSKTVTTSPEVDASTTRFLYKGSLSAAFSGFDQTLTCVVEPHLQARSNIAKNCSHYKGFVRCGVEWALPERMLYSPNYDCVQYFQPVLRWSYLPKFYQDCWRYIDKHDRFYPENRIELSVRNNWAVGDFHLDLIASQGYDFYNRSDIFPLRRCYGQQHLTPFSLHAHLGYKGLSLSIDQEYAWRTISLMQSEVSLSFLWKNYECFIGYLYQKEALRTERELFSDIPAFALVGCSFPIGKKIRIHYDGSFYSRQKRMFPMFNTMKPMLHRVRLDYEGHCWGLSVGWEEKRYRQSGDWKSERAITLALKLESIGSFAQKFRRPLKPLIYRAPSGYRP